MAPGVPARDGVLGSRSRHRLDWAVLLAVWESAGKAAEAPEAVRESLLWKGRPSCAARPERPPSTGHYPRERAVALRGT